MKQWFTLLVITSKRQKPHLIYVNEIGPKNAVSSLSSKDMLGELKVPEKTFHVIALFKGRVKMAMVGKQLEDVWLDKE